MMMLKRRQVYLGSLVSVLFESSWSDTARRAGELLGGVGK